MASVHFHGPVPDEATPWQPLRQTGLTRAESGRSSATSRLRKGSANSARGAARLVADAIRTARAAGVGGAAGTGLIVLRADSAFYGYPVIAAARRAGAHFSVPARASPAVTRAIGSIDQTAWQSIQFPGRRKNVWWCRWWWAAGRCRCARASRVTQDQKPASAKIKVRRGASGLRCVGVTLRFPGVGEGLFAAASCPTVRPSSRGWASVLLYAPVPGCEPTRMPSLVDLVECAEEHVRHYLDPASARAFAAYDVQGDPHTLLPVDILAPALLGAPVRSREVIALQQPEGNYRILWNALQAVLTHTDPDGDPFE